MAIDAGKLRHRVRIERFMPEHDSNGKVIQSPTTGEVRKTWQEIATVWAAVEPLSAREFVQSQALQSQVSARIVMRFIELLPQDRLVHLSKRRGDVIYNPEGALEDKGSGLEYLTIPVSRGVNKG